MTQSHFSPFYLTTFKKRPLIIFQTGLYHVKGEMLMLQVQAKIQSLTSTTGKRQVAKGEGVATALNAI